MTRRDFARVWAAAAGVAVAPVMAARAAPSGSTALAEGQTVDGKPSAASAAAEDDKLQSEFLCDLVLEKGQASNIGSVGVNRVVVSVSGGTFEGPRLKGTVIGPSGDWIAARPDGSSLLDLRAVLQTDDSQKILMTCRGIAFVPPGGALWARILPGFETGAAKYAWLNNVVAVGVNRPAAGKVAYRIYRIL